MDQIWLWVDQTWNKPLYIYRIVLGCGTCTNSVFAALKLWPTHYIKNAISTTGDIILTFCLSRSIYRLLLSRSSPFTSSAPVTRYPLRSAYWAFIFSSNILDLSEQIRRDYSPRRTDQQATIGGCCLFFLLLATAAAPSNLFVRQRLIASS